MAAEFMAIEPDPDHDEVNSQYDSCYSSASDNTTTIVSGVTDYKYEHGRRYHKYSEGHYWYPNDEQQNNQLDIFHQVYTLALDNRLHVAPIGDAPLAILDLGTGTGCWAIDAADKYPGARVLGNDLSPIQPAWIPSNLAFEVDDFTKPWLHSSDTFTLIHARALYGSVTDWPTLLHEALTALHPGGYFESIENSITIFTDTTPDGALPADSALSEWTTKGIGAAKKAGRPFDIAPGEMGRLLSAAGFEDVHERILKLPIGPWPLDRHMKEIGRWNLLNLLEAAEGFSLVLFTRLLHWSLSEVRDLLNRVTVEMKDRTRRIYLKMYVTYARKPGTLPPPDRALPEWEHERKLARERERLREEKEKEMERERDREGEEEVLDVANLNLNANDTSDEGMITADDSGYSTVGISAP